MALIALGSNVGRPAEHLRAAIDHLSRPGSGVDAVRVSPFHETAPVGGPSGQNVYANAVAWISTRLDPAELQARLQAMERNAGRTAGPVWGSRPLDLDILAYDRLTLRTPVLVIPHPRMTVRRFVLDPLAEIAPDWIHPQLGWSIQAMIDHLENAPPIVNYGTWAEPFGHLSENDEARPWRFERQSPAAMFDIAPISQFDPADVWIRPRFYPGSEEPGAAFSQILATCDSLRPIGKLASN